jgi:CHAD domain-containing protein
VSASVPVERELKLRVPPGFRLSELHGPHGEPGATSALPNEARSGECLAEAPDGAGVIASEPSTERLSTTYFDTADLRLSRWGCSLRHRVGEGWTVKLPSTTEGSLLERGEHLFPGGPARPPEAAVDLVRAYVRTSSLAPVARLRTLRTTIRLASTDGRTLATLVDDEVSVLDGRHVAARFREVELEAADELSNVDLEAIAAPLRRAGAADADGTPKHIRALGPVAVGAPELLVRDLGARPSLRDVVALALTSSVIRLLRSDAGVRLGDDPEAVHRARVAVRRLRAHLRTYRGVLDPGWSRSLREELGWLGGGLGRLRDADVLYGRMRTSAGALPEADGAAAARVLRRLRDDRQAARAATLAARRSGRYVELLERLVAGAQAPPALEEASAAATEALPRLMDRPWRHLSSAMDALTSESSEETLHAARIRAKQARYAAESMAVVYGKPARVFADRAAELQDILGEHQDAVTAEAWLREAAGTAGPRTAFVAGELAARERRAAARARRRWPTAWKRLSRKGAVFWT